MSGFFYRYRCYLGCCYIISHNTFIYIEIVVVEILQLIEVSTDFACLQTICACIIQHENIFGATNHSIEMICINAILMLIYRQTESFAQSERNKRISAVFQWKHTFIERKYDKIFEIYGTGFENTHNLESGQWFTSERDCYIMSQLFEQSEVCVYRNTFCST